MLERTDHALAVGTAIAASRSATGAWPVEAVIRGMEAGMERWGIDVPPSQASTTASPKPGHPWR